jgi:NAD-dependent SIR2 family protein deacetylase
MTECEKCGASIKKDVVPFHEAWHADLDERFKAVFDSLTGLFQISNKMTDPL